MALELADVSDPAAIAAALASDPFVRGGTDTALISIRYDSTGLLRSAEIDHPDASAEDEERIGKLLTERLSPTGPRRASRWLTLSRGDSADLRPFEPQSERRPEIQNRREIGRLLQVEADSSPSMQGREAVFRLLIDPRGRVEDAVLHKSTGSTPLDLAMSEIIRRARFSPALLGQYPVSVWIQLPLTIGWNPTPG